MKGIEGEIMCVVLGPKHDYPPHISVTVKCSIIDSLHILGYFAHRMRIMSGFFVSLSLCILSLLSFFMGPGPWTVDTCMFIVIPLAVFGRNVNLA